MVLIRLDLPDVRVLQTELAKKRELIIPVERTLDPATGPQCGRTHVLWPVRKAADDLEAAAQAGLERLCAPAPPLKPADALRQDLTQLFETAPSRDEGLEHVPAWAHQLATSGRTCFDSCLGPRATGPDLIANYVRARQRSGLVEGVNNTLTRIKRRCYGCTNRGRFFQHITLDVAGAQWFSPWRQPVHSIWTPSR
jgi:hypothetical protein